MTTFEAFTKNPDLVFLNTGHTEFEICHPTRDCTDRETGCISCPFESLKSCFVDNSSKNFQPIYDFFKLHHPEKLL